LSQNATILDRFLLELVSTLGFARVRPLVYSRPAPPAVGLLVFPQREPGGGLVRFTCTVGLRFAEIESLLHYAPVENAPTISMPLHLLRKEKSYSEWELDAGCLGADAEAIRAAVLADLKDSAIPFIERYCTLHQVRAKLESIYPTDWFTLDPEQRLTILAAIEFMEGDRVTALRRLDVGLDERKDALPKKRIQLENLRARLAK
jgi:hypothetical protein